MQQIQELTTWVNIWLFLRKYASKQRNPGAAEHRRKELTAAGYLFIGMDGWDRTTSNTKILVALRRDAKEDRKGDPERMGAGNRRRK